MAVNKYIEELLAPVKLPLAYRQFIPYENNPVPNPPYLIYLVDNETGRGADGKNLVLRKGVTIELYTDEKNVELEEKVENAISEYEYEKNEVYISSEEMYMIYYNFEIFEKIRRQ